MCDECDSEPAGVLVHVHSADTAVPVDQAGDHTPPLSPRRKLSLPNTPSGETYMYIQYRSKKVKVPYRNSTVPQEYHERTKSEPSKCGSVRCGTVRCDSVRVR